MTRVLHPFQLEYDPSNPKDAVHVAFVEAAVGEHFKRAVRVVATTNVAGTYNSKVITGSTVLGPVDGVTLQDGDRLLLAGQGDATQNGIYVVTSAANPFSLTRADDFQASDQIKAGVKVHVNQGTANADFTYVLTGDGPFTLDSTPLDWSISKGVSVAVVQRTFEIAGVAQNNTVTYSFTHNWGTRAVTAEVLDKSASYATVIADVSRPTDDSVNVTFAKAPQQGEDYLVILRAEV